MRNGLQKYLLVLLTVGLCALPALGQGVSTGSLSGTVTDPKGAVVAGATVTVKNAATNQEFSTQTNNNGAYSITTLSSGVYTATITAAGFKQAAVTDIKIDVAKASTINVELEIGSANETVTVVGGGELLQTQNATVGTTLTGRQITDLPTASRDALDLVLTMPGTATPGRPRTSSVNGLPKGALNITIDGINVQDNLLKSNDGFFTYIRPRTDAISEVTVSTSNPGSESAAEGAVQIKFVTQGGSNEYHGGLYWYHRNPALNANYWFNNRDLPPDPVTRKAPQSRILLNQPGGKVGGPIRIPKLFNGTDRAFFFVNYEEFRLPERTPLRTRTILTEPARNGIFRYEAAIPSGGVPGACTTTGATSGLMRCSVNLYSIAAAGLFPSTPDPTIGALLGEIRGSVNGLTVRPVVVAAGSAAELNRELVSFTNIGGQVRKFPTVRLDFNITKKHHLENIWNYQKFDGVVDFLNNVDPAFPGFPNHGAQTSIRWSNVAALRSTLTNNIVNEARMGWVGGITHFFSDVNPGQFANQGGYNLGIGAAGITSATVTAAPSRRNSPVKQFQDTLTWNTGSHTFSFGGEVTRVNLFSQSFTRVVPAVAFGVDQTLDATLFNGMFTSGNFPGSTAGIRNTAAAIYATLTGRTTQWSYTGIGDEQGKYVINGDLIRRMHQTTYGFYAQDSWRLRPNLTLTVGLRNEALLPYVAENKSYSFATYDQLFGVSGTDNLFKPGTLTGSPTTFVELGASGQKPFNEDRWNLLPSFGFSYSPNWKSGLLGWLNGSGGQTVIRGGFSRASVREGTNVFQAITGSNPGPTFTANRSISLSGANNLPVGTLLRNGTIPAANNVPSSVVYPFVPSITDSVNAFIPDLKLGYVDSYTFGIQREITKDTVLEVRYVGNRGKDLWRQYDLNETNTIENGYFNEFKLAQQNLVANINAGRGLNFRYFGPGTGTAPLPIHLVNFQGATVSGLGPCGAANATCAIDPTNPAHYLASNTNWTNANFTAALNPLAPNVFGIASTLAFSTSTFLNNRNAVLNSTLTSASLKALATPNFFLVNPGLAGGGSFIIDNSTRTSYDAFQFEWRRRMSKGLLIQGSYTFSKSQSNYYASSSSVFKNYFSQHDRSLDQGINPYDITHAFKTNFLYELPVGRGRQFLSGASGILNGLLGGWGANGFIRWQSGNPVNFGNVQLVGMDRDEFQSMIRIRKDPTAVFYLPADVITNTARAFAVNFASGTNQPIYTNGAPSGKFLAPAGFGNCLQEYTGRCGITNLVVKGPAFIRADLSLVKKVQFNERMNLELRGEFLNAFNNINFLIGNPANDLNGAPLSGVIGNAYQDSSTTNDPGGRLVQIVVRFNF
ncbi:MAG TPA: carboxypeptidase-like regulatory domain-containing protein [Pyrinomonadaceae bacterium]|nr:carboxypeptidase-like regulatory domain-containing protein [Pyrinomonadaceae bacterium]